jgi:hypothetical protein
VTDVNCSNYLGQSAAPILQVRMAENLSAPLQSRHLPPSPPAEKAGILIPFSVSFYRFEFMPIAARRGT